MDDAPKTDWEAGTIAGWKRRRDWELAGRHRPVEIWHVPICGFTQSLAAPTGIELLWQSLRREHHNGRVCVLDPQCWNRRWEDLAEFVWRFRPAATPRIAVYAYSWGAGWGFVQFAKALRRRGLIVDVAVLCDPVYRHGWIGNWRALWPASTIRVPCNVSCVHWLYQRQSWPRGHQPVPEDPTNTSVMGGHEIEDTDHTYMDDHPAFHRLALAVAASLDPPIAEVRP